MQIGAWLDELDVGAPEIGPEAVEELRADIDAALAGAAGRQDPPPLRMGKARLADLGCCERLAVANSRSPDVALTTPMLWGSALDLFVAHQLRAGPVLDPVGDLAELLTATAAWEHLAVLDSLSDQEARTAAEPLAAAAREWADVDPSWVPRTQVRATAAFVDGRVVVAGRTDVELGGLDTGRPGVVVEVKSGTPRASHLAESYLYALLCALRDGRAPGWAACWYPGTSPSATPVSLGVLESAAGRLVAGVQRWLDLESGANADESPGPWCAWCPDAQECPSAAPGAPGSGTQRGG